MNDLFNTYENGSAPTEDWPPFCHVLEVNIFLCIAAPNYKSQNIHRVAVEEKKTNKGFSIFLFSSLTLRKLSNLDHTCLGALTH